MKKLILLIIPILLLSCGNDEEETCACTSQRWERTVIRSTVPPLNIISETQWVKAGDEKAAGSDCAKSGQISTGNTSVLIQGTNNTTEKHWEERITCR